MIRASKTITLPLWFERQHRLLNEGVLKKRGFTPGTKAFEREMQKLLQKKAREAYLHSYVAIQENPAGKKKKRTTREVGSSPGRNPRTTRKALAGVSPGKRPNTTRNASISPGGNPETTRKVLAGFSPVKNPFTPIIPKRVYDLYPVLMGPDGFFEDAASRRMIPSGEVADFQKRLRSAVGNIAQMYMEAGLGLDPTDSYRFKKDESKSPEVIANRIKRVFIAQALLEAVSRVFEMKPEEFDRIMKELGIHEEAKNLERGDKREQFEKLTVKALQDAFKEVDLAKFFASRLQKRSE